MALPPGLRIPIAVVLAEYPMHTVGDVLFANEDEELMAFLDVQDENVKKAWATAVAWAKAKTEQTKLRIYGEGLGGTGPVAASRGSPPQPVRPPDSQSAGRRTLRPSRPSRAPDAAPEARDLAKRTTAAHRVLAIVRAAGQHSDLNAEYTPDTASEWEELYLAALTGDGKQAGYEHGTLYRAAAAWNRWQVWAKKHRPTADPFAPQPVALAAFFKSLELRGPTAASGAFTSLEWIRRHARIDLPLDAEVVAHYRHPQAGHAAEQQKPLHLQAFAKLISILEDSAAPWRRCAAALALRVLLSGLRFAHVRRASREHESCTPRTEVWKVSRGKQKGRGGFKTASPTHVKESMDLSSFIDPLQSDMPAAEADLLLPDIVIGANGLDGGCKFGPGPMSRDKFLDIVASLLEDAAPAKLTTYSFRRWLPTIAGALDMPIDRRRDLGNWVDTVADGSTHRTREPMAVRYSQQRLEATAQVKRVCLAATAHLLRFSTSCSVEVDFTHYTGCIKSMATLERNTMLQRWGQAPASSFPDLESVPPVPDLTEDEHPKASDEQRDGDKFSTSASSSTSSSLDSTSGEEADTTGQFHVPEHLSESIEWIAPSEAPSFTAGAGTPLSNST